MICRPITRQNGAAGCLRSTGGHNCALFSPSRYPCTPVSLENLHSFSTASRSSITPVLHTSRQNHLVLPRRRRPDRLDHLANELGSRFGHGFVLRERHVRQQGCVPDDARLGVAVDVGLPLPARRVRVARPDVFGLQALEFLLGAELVGLERGEERLVCFVKGRQGSGSQVETLGARNGHTIVMRLRKVLVEMSAVMITPYFGGVANCARAATIRDSAPVGSYYWMCAYVHLLWARIRLAVITHQSSGGTLCLLISSEDIFLNFAYPTRDNMVSSSASGRALMSKSLYS